MLRWYPCWMGAATVDNDVHAQGCARAVFNGQLLRGWWSRLPTGGPMTGPPVVLFRGTRVGSTAHTVPLASPPRSTGVQGHREACVTGGRAGRVFVYPSVGYRPIRERGDSAGLRRVVSHTRVGARMPSIPALSASARGERRHRLAWVRRPSALPRKGEGSPSLAAGGGGSLDAVVEVGAAVRGGRCGGDSTPDSTSSVNNRAVGAVNVMHLQASGIALTYTFFPRPTDLKPDRQRKLDRTYACHGETTYVSKQQAVPR